MILLNQVNRFCYGSRWKPNDGVFAEKIKHAAFKESQMAENDRQHDVYIFKKNECMFHFSFGSRNLKFQPYFLLAEYK